MSFRLPEEARYLSDGTKGAFMNAVDLTTAEKRMKALFAACPQFIAEMERVHQLATAYRVYSFISKNIGAIKWMMYALVVLLNLNVLMVSFGAEKTAEGYGYYNIAAAAADPGDKWLSVYITLLLAIINLFGYLVIVCFIGVTEVPIMIREVDAKRDQALAVEGKRPRTRNPRAFDAWAVVLFFNIMFVIMHNENYKQPADALVDKSQYRTNLYMFLFFGINLPWTMSCVRNYIVVPDTPPSRIFVIIYEVVLSKPFFRNHVVLMCFSIIGFTNNEFFSLMLLDIMNNSLLLQNIILCVTVPGTQLLSVFYLFIVTAIIYAQFGLQYYEEYFTKECHSAVSCFWLIMYNGMPAGNLGGVLNSRSNRGAEGGPDFMLRMLFDIAFFIWIGILLFNIITGLMIDTFGALRAKGNARDDVLSNQGFVNGITRTQFDDLALPNAPSFDDMNKKEQNPWAYVYYYQYLAKKNPLGFTGVDSYVKDCLDRTDMKWLPTRTSFVIQNASEADDEVGESDEMPDILKTIGGGSAELKKVVAGLGQRLDELEEKAESKAA